MHDHFAVLCRAVNNIYQGFGFQCNGTEATLASCQARGAVLSRDYGIALTCGGSTGATTGAIPDAIPGAIPDAASIFGLSAYILSLFSAIIAAYFCM